MRKQIKIKKPAKKKAKPIAKPAPIRDEVVLTTVELAERWKMAPNTLKVWRSQRPRRGPNWFSNGRRVLYLISEIQAYEQKHIVKTREGG